MLTSLAMGALAAAFIIPGTRRAFLGDPDHDWLAGELELDHILPDGMTVKTKSGLFSRVIHIAGLNYDAKTSQVQEHLLKGRNSAFHALGDHGIGLRFFGIKRPCDISYEADWPSPALHEIGVCEQAQFQGSFAINWYLLATGSVAARLNDGLEKFFATLSDYGPEYLCRAETGPCPLTGFLNGLVSGDYRDDLPAISNSISGSLPASDFHADRTTGIIRTFLPEAHYQKIITVRAWPESVDGRLQHDILSLAGEIEISQICLPVSNVKAMALLSRREKELCTALIGDSEALAQVRLVLNLLTDAKNTWFITQYQVVCRSTHPDDLDRLVKDVCRVLGQSRAIFQVETVGAPTCWFNRICGNNRLLRPLKLLNHDLAALWPFHYASRGRLSSPYGNRPVRLFTTPSGQTYSAQFHVSNRPQSLGNYLVFAPAGSGKSTLILHLLGGLAKFGDVPAYIFDSHEGARYMVETFGGVYQGYDQLALNPLDVGEDSKLNRQRIHMILRAMVGQVADDAFDEAFSLLADLAFQLEPPERSFNNLFEYVFPRKSPLRAVFKKWVVDDKGNEGLHAHVFNAPYDSLQSVLARSHMTGINMNEALRDDQLGPPVVAHIAEAIRAVGLRKRGFNIFIDEAANLLRNEGFRSFVKEMFREYRKLDGCVGLAFQDPEALERSGIARPVLENTASLFFFPNANANPQSLAAFNLNEEQLSFVMGASEREGRHVLVIQRDAASGIDESAIINVDLTNLGPDILRFYRAGTEANRHLATLKREWGDAWLNHV